MQGRDLVRDAVLEDQVAEAIAVEITDGGDVPLRVARALRQHGACANRAITVL